MLRWFVVDKIPIKNLPWESFFESDHNLSFFRGFSRVENAAVFQELGTPSAMHAIEAPHGIKEKIGSEFFATCHLVKRTLID
ncbi:MAG: hypothetical protein CMR00_11425 [[Chlorobium] sp. 445]|nr:MAG: hypothetical protein CMR00_11425 [[Chlorobium] sp. 445]